MRRVAYLAAPASVNRSAGVVLFVAAVALGVAGYLHGRLFHQGYGDVPVVGPLFFLNVIGSASAIVLLLARRPLLFVAATVSISLGAIVSILISHNARFFGFSEQGYSTDAKVILASEAAAVVLVVAGVALGRRRLLPVHAPAA